MRWNGLERRIESRLRAIAPQRVRIPRAGLEITFESGETIWTESSHKYAPEEPLALAERTGFECAGQWRDDAWPFAETLLVAR